MLFWAHTCFVPFRQLIDTAKGNIFPLNRAHHLIKWSSDNIEIDTHYIRLILDSSYIYFLDLCTQSSLISPVLFMHQRDMNVRLDYNQRTQSTSGIKKRTLHPLPSLCISLGKILKQVGEKIRGNLDDFSSSPYKARSAVAYSCTCACISDCAHWICCISNQM